MRTSKRKKNAEEFAKLFPKIKCFSMNDEKVNPIAPMSISLSIVDVDTLLSILKEMAEIKKTAYENADEETSGHIQLQISLANELHEKIYNQKKIIMGGLL